MGTPTNALPELIAKDVIQELLRTKGFARATNIVSPKVTAQYHGIYFITLPPSDKTLGHSELVLRVSGRHLPGIKTRNEVGIMTWIARNTTIPIPDLVAYDATESNPIAYEYTLLSRVAGATLSDIYESLDDTQQDHILDQLIDYLCQLQAHPWDGIGGLALDDAEGVVLAQVVDETSWQVPDVMEYWPPGETVHSLNIKGPYRTYIEYITAQIEQSIRLIQIHKKLEFMCDAIPRLEAFIAVLPQHADELNKVPLRLAHKDLHFANMLFDTSSNMITAILDWEFAGIVPFTQWNPRRAFLWNGVEDEKSMVEKKKWMDLFEQRCAQKSILLLEEAKFVSPLQESMHKVANFLRAILEVTPRGQKQDKVSEWKATVLENIGQFGV